MPLVRVLVSFGVLYFVLAVAAIYLSRQEGNIATLWFANALGIAYLLRQPRSRYPAILLSGAAANVCANLAFGDSLALSLAFVPPNVLEMLLGSEFIRRTRVDERFNESPVRLLRFILVGCCSAPLLSATLGAATVSWMGSVPFARVWLAWYIGTTIGAIGLLPVALLIVRKGLALFYECVEWLKTLPFMVAAVTTSLFALLYVPNPFIYITLPLIIAAAILSFEGTALVVWVSSLTTGAMIATGYFKVPSITTHWQLLSVYVPVLLTMIPPLVLAVSMKEVRIKERSRQRVEQALAQSHQELQTIIDHMPAMIAYWDKDLINHFGNQAYEQWFGVIPNRLRGMHIRELIGEDVFRQNQPYLQGVLRGEPQMFERDLVDQAGAVRHTLASYIPDVDKGEVKGFYAFVTDITSLKNAQKEQAQAQDQLQGVIDAASEFSIIATDLQGIIKVFSVGAERMLGYSAAEVVDKQSPAILHVPDEVIARGEVLSAQFGRPISGFDVFVVLARQGQPESREWTYVRKDGSRLPVNLVVTAIHDAKGEITGFLGIANDISMQRQLLSSLVSAKEQAEAASLAKSAFVANMSHEIRTPMNAVLGMTRLLSGTPLSVDQKKYLEMIQVSGQSLLGILNDILDFSKIEAGRMELSHEIFDLNDVLNGLANIMSVNASEKDLELAIGLEPDVPLQWRGDALRLQQILINLVGNAIKFTAQGEVSVWVGLDQNIEADGDKASLCFSVRDTGIGMDAGQTSRLFSAFSQADNSTTRRFGGTGLGLTISRRLAELMNGRIEVFSSLGVGSEFRFTVPLTHGPVVAPVKSERLVQVLIVDDNKTSRAALALMLQRCQLQADVVESGALAIAKIAAGAHYDLALVDAQMPEMGGLSTLQALRQQPLTRALPVVLMTSPFGRESLVQQRTSSQADAILTKPVTASLLCSSLKEILTGYSNSSSERAMAVQSDHLLELATEGLNAMHLLLVEDNPLNQIVAKGLLLKAGITVDIVDNGQKAVEQLRQNPKVYEMVLMDVQMPVMDGFTATRLIRSELQLTLPIVAMSAGVMESEQEECRAAGMNDFIAKPIEYERMLAVIARNVLSDHQGRI